VVAKDSPVEVDLLKSQAPPIQHPLEENIGGNAMAAARVSKSRREREWVRGKEISSQPRGTHPSPPLHGRGEPLHGRRCPVPVNEGEIAMHCDAVLSTVEEKEMRGENTFLPLAGRQTMVEPPSPLHTTTRCQVDAFTDKRDTRDAGPTNQ
jgi:hypothetical protein